MNDLVMDYHERDIHDHQQFVAEIVSTQPTPLRISAQHIRPLLPVCENSDDSDLDEQDVAWNMGHINLILYRGCKFCEVLTTFSMSRRWCSTKRLGLFPFILQGNN
jgi:hypothetical protein